MIHGKFHKLKMARNRALAIAIPIILFCNRDNPLDVKSPNYIPPKKPHAMFLLKNMSAFLYDTIEIPIVWSDTAAGGLKGAIKTFFFAWHNDRIFDDSIKGMKPDTFVIKKAFPAGTMTARIKALDVNGAYSDVDSMNLIIRMSRPRIDSIDAPSLIEKSAQCTVSVFASDSGGKIQSYVWAKNGTNFTDTTAVRTFYVSFKDTGEKVLLVKVRDNKAVESAIDTFHIGVYEKFYTTFYNGNGSTGGTLPIDTNRYARGRNFTVLGNTGSLVKTGFVFAGWNTLANGRGASYTTGSIFAIDTADVVLYAQWTILPTFAVTYNGNGSNGGTVPTDTAHYASGQSVTVLGNTGSLVKAGFTFIGWNTQANGSGISYATSVAFTMGSSNVTLYAQWTANPTYTVTYNGNGNSGGTPPADNNNYPTGASVTVLGNTGNLVKTGNTFVGWNTQANGNGTSYAGGVTFAMGSVSVTLYARWTANPTYTVTYLVNGSGSGTVPKDNNNYLTGANVTVLGNTGTLARTGYTFTGWDTVANGNGTNYAVGATFIMASSNVTLYAQWTIISTYTVIYDGNGATSGNAPADNNHYTLGQSVMVLGNTGSLVKAGFTFIGWNTQANGSGISYATGVAFAMGSSNVTLYAQWTANPTYTVTYNGNVNSGGTVPVDNNNYTTGASVTVLGNTGALVKTGSTFVGWNTQANGNGTSYAGGATFAMGSVSVTLYARWTANPTYTVTYLGNGSGSGTVPNDNNNYLTGANVTVLGNTGTLARTGYTFAGWDTVASGNGANFAVGATFIMASSNVILYAQWTIIPTFTVTYDDNGSTGGNAPADINHYTLGQNVTVLGNTGSLVKAGFAFIGWNTQANGSGISYATGVAFAMGSSNVTLYARWTANPTYTVTYNGNVNSGGTVPVDNNNYTTGASVTVLGNTGALVKTGYTFVGWNTQANGNGTSYAGGATFAMGSANSTLFANWTANPTYTVTYLGNGSSGGTVPKDNNNYLTGANVTALGNTGTLARTGYTFAGWDTGANGNGTNYAVGATFIMASANVILYAQWTIISTFTVTYNANGATGGSIPKDTAHYAQGQNDTIRGNTGLLVKTGFTFIGWNTQANDSGISYATGVAFAMGSSNVTLYARWTANPTYTVTYNGNGGIGAQTDPNQYLAGVTVTVRGQGTLQITGYTFTGWNRAQDGSLKSYAVNDTLIMGSANVTLYAQWTALPAPTIVSPISGATNQSINPTLSWNLVTGATAYRLQASMASDFLGGIVYDDSGLTSNSQAIGTLLNNTTYYWRVRAKNNGGISAWSSTWIFTTIVAAPAASALSSPLNGATNQSINPTLSWNLVTGAVTYRLQASTASDFSALVYDDSTRTINSQVIGTLLNNTTYYWRVQAKNIGGVSAWSSTWSFTTIVAAPATPTLVSPAIGATDQSINPMLSWNLVSGDVTYRLQASTASDFSALVYDDSTRTSNSQAIGILLNNMTYYWRVRAKNNGGISAWSSIWSFTTIVASSGAPTLSSPPNNATNQSINPTLSWNLVTGAVTYRLQASTTIDFLSGIVYDDSVLTSNSQAIGTLLNNTTYYWRVQAKNNGGISAWSSIWSFTTIVAVPATPTLVSPAIGATNQSINPTLSWNLVTGAMTYRLQASSASDFSGLVYDDSVLTSNSQVIGTLLNNTTYYWRVQAKNNGGISAWSSIWSFATVLAAPALNSPLNGATNQSINPTLSWSTVNGFTTYRLQVSTAIDFSSGIVYDDSTRTINSQAISALLNNTTYYWRVWAKNTGSTSAWSSTWSFTTVLAAPALSSPLNGTMNESINPTLSWSTVNGFTTYRLQVSTASNFLSGVVYDDSVLTSNSQAIGTLLNNMTYYWRVWAKNTGSTSAWSSTWSFTTVLAAPALSSPLNGTTNESINPTLSWSTVNGFTTYRLQVSTAIDFSSGIAYDDSTRTINSQAINTLLNNTTYYWRVWAKNTGSTSAWSSTWSFTTIVAAPAAPTIISPASSVTQLSSPKLKWSTVSGATSYEVQVSFSSTIIKDITLTSDSLVIGPLSNSGTYVWQVQAQNIGGVSAWSSSSFTADVIPPTVSPTNPSNGDTVELPLPSITATFSEAMDAATITAAFTLQGSPPVSGEVSYDADSKTATFTPATETPLESGTTYTATIASGVTDIAGNPMGSDFIWSFTTK
jgi:uncharacterized repeat protein (TIGR02543 family)